MNNLKNLKTDWENLDKSDFSEKIEFEYDENDPLYIKLNEMADEIDMPIEDLISALIYQHYKNSLDSF